MTIIDRSYLEQLEKTNLELELALIDKSLMLERFNESQRIAKIGNWEWDIKTGKVWWSSEVYRVFELNPETYTPGFEENTKYVHPDDQEQYVKDVTDSFKSGNMLDIDLRIITPIGKTKHCNLTGKVYFDKDGSPSRYAGTFMDITEKKQAQANILELDRHFRYIMNGVHLLSVILDEKGYITFCSDYLLQVTGYDGSELIGKNWFDLMIPSEITTEIKEVFHGILNDSKSYSSYENEILTKNGEKLIISWNNGIFHSPDLHIIGVASIGENITERKNAEEKLRISEERLRFSLEGANDGVWDVNLDTHEFYMSPRGCEILGFQPEEIPAIAKTWIDLAYPDDLPETFAKLNAYLDGTSPIFEVEQRLKTKSGKWKWILSRGKATGTDINGKVNRMTGTHTDISQRRIYETQLIENQAILEQQNKEYLKARDKAEESDRLKTVFLQNMSHEIRTPMNAIMGFSDLLTHNFNNKAKLENFTSIIKQRCSDLLELINEILDLSKIETGQLPINIEECNVTELFRELYQFFINHSLKICKPHIELQFVTEFDPQQMHILTDKGKLKQIFINLIHNAYKFTEKGSIRFGCLAGENNHMLFFVSDTGIGIPEDKQTAIYDRFLQLNTHDSNTQGGTGLGLSIVKGLVELLGGEIKLKSKINEGSSFFFSISYQIAEPKEEKSAKSTSRADTKWHAYTLLIVEDDRYNSEYLNEVLSATGIHILTATNAEQSIEMVKSGQSIDIILMDIRMSAINGYEATTIIKRENPRIKIIAQTAYATNNDHQNAINAGCDGYISKPIHKDSLLSMIQEHLNGGVSNTG